jgi:Dioxygenases related to 2-nitropropane dioxygenase
MKKLNEILGTEFPFIQGGMAHIATGEFAAACSNAGALGMIATGGWDGERLPGGDPPGQGADGQALRREPDAHEPLR